MTREQIFEYARAQYGAEAEYPWGEAEAAVLRRCDNRKWFGVVMHVRRDRLGLRNEGFEYVLNVKSDPLLIGALRQEEGFLPAYHMNKEKWISIRLNAVPLERACELIDLSFSLTGPKRKKDP